MSTKTINEQPMEALWKKAEASGMSRRKFLVLLAGSGAAAVLSACTSATVSPPSPSPTASAAATPTAPPSPTLPPVVEPVPAQYFNPIGGGNYEMRFELMANRAYAMPDSFFFVRDHTSTPYPPVDLKTWNLSIEGDGVAQPLKMSYDDLLAMPATTVTRYVECAGNGRSFYDTLLHHVAQGGQWHLGAYGIAEWTGVKLSDILNKAGMESSAVDVMPAGFDSLKVRLPTPAAKAMEADTLIAYMMNGDILPIDHGFPARALTPGYVGVSNIKWLNTITVSTTPQFSDWNTKLYILVGPDYTTPTGSSGALGPAVYNQVLKSACCLPWPATLKAGSQKIVGYAWSPAGKIAAVDVSLDGGNTFQPATLTGSNIERAGSRWEFTFTANSGQMTITPRATDDQGNKQYPVSQQKWNLQGYIFGAMVPHPVTVS